MKELNSEMLWPVKWDSEGPSGLKRCLMGPVQHWISTSHSPGKSAFQKGLCSLSHFQYNYCQSPGPIFLTLCSFNKVLDLKMCSENLPSVSWTRYRKVDKGAGEAETAGAEGCDCKVWHRAWFEVFCFCYQFSAGFFFCTIMYQNTFDKPNINIFKFDRRKWILLFNSSQQLQIPLLAI